MRLILALIFLATSSLQSQTSFDFLRLDISPRAASLGGSYVANGDDPNVIFYNPAGINSLEGRPVSFSFLKHLVDINSASLAYSHNFESIGRFGAAIQYINYGTFTEADETGTETGEFSANEFALTIGYSNILDDNFNYGANIKFIYSGIAEETSTAFAFDIGLLYNLPKDGWRFGISILNLGSQMSSYFDKQEDLPLDMRLGVYKKLEHTPFEFYFSFNKLNEKDDRFSSITAGGEINLSKTISLRLGYDNEKRKELKLGTSAGLAGFHAGIGINVSDYKVDYAFSSLGSIGAMHRIGITTDLY